MSRVAVAQPAASTSAIRPGSTHSAPPVRSSPYSPSTSELKGGPQNRLFLSIRSGIDSEIDWALPRLVVGSYEQADNFRLEVWVDSVAILQQWPEKWISELERLSAAFAVQNGAEAPSNVKGLVFEWTINPVTERRATESLLILRNAALAPNTNNGVLICRPSFLGLLERFFALPHDFLVDVTLRYPEPVSHLLSVLNSIIGLLKPYPDFIRIFSTVLPTLFLDIRDSAMMTLMLPLFIATVALPDLPPLPTEFIPHIFRLLALKPSSPLLELLLDLLVSLSQNPIYAKQILQDHHLPAYLKTIVPSLGHASKPFPARWESAPSNAGKVIRNPASNAFKAEEASLRRAREREEYQRLMENGAVVDVPVGDAPPVLPQSIKNKLYAMKEPQRSITWMHETFVYSSRSQLLQVVFWHAYRDFFTHSATVEQLLSASEVIKNVTIAFPGASAKVWTDATGQQKFVIAGMGFRRSSDDDNAFACRWNGCAQNFVGASATDLFDHVLGKHVRSAEVSPTSCEWASCRLPFTGTQLEDHIATHLPTSSPARVPETITVHPSVPDHLALGPRPLSRPPAPLPRTVKLSFTAQYTPSDARRQPTGPPFLAALILRNLARSLRTEIALDVAPEENRPDAVTAGQEKKKHLLEERYGLPIPDSVLREEEEEERNAERDEEDLMNPQQRERAILAFQAVEEKVLEVMENNMAGLAVYLGTAVGW